MIAVQNTHPLCLRRLTVSAAYIHKQVTLSTGNVVGKVSLCAAEVHIIALVGYSGSLAGVNHSLNLSRISEIMGIEDARSARHGEQVGVGSQCIFLYRIRGVTGCRTTILHVMILDECDSILTVVGIMNKVVGAVELRPVIAVNGITNAIAELEVESSALLSCSVDPILNSRVGIPALTD